jgi:Tfp pilus assembly protein PilO
VNIKLPATFRIDALFGLVAAAATACAGAVAVGPHLLAQAPTAQEQMAAIEERRKAATELAADLVNLNKRLEELHAESETAVHLIPVSTANARLLALTKLAESHGVTIAQVTSLASDTKDPRATVIPIKLSGTATYSDATAFLSDLRKEFRDTSVTGFKISAVPAATAPTATFAMDLAWYAAPAGGAGSAGSAGGAGAAGAGTKSP